VNLKNLKFQEGNQSQNQCQMAEITTFLPEKFKPWEILLADGLAWGKIDLDF
jgi:hypothetical protein